MNNAILEAQTNEAVPEHIRQINRATTVKRESEIVRRKKQTGSAYVRDRLCGGSLDQLVLRIYDAWMLIEDGDPHGAMAILRKVIRTDVGHVRGALYKQDAHRALLALEDRDSAEALRRLAIVAESYERGGTV